MTVIPNIKGEITMIRESARQVRTTRMPHDAHEGNTEAEEPDLRCKCGKCRWKKWCATPADTAPDETLRDFLDSGRTRETSQVQVEAYHITHQAKTHARNIQAVDYDRNLPGTDPDTDSDGAFRERPLPTGSESILFIDDEQVIVNLAQEILGMLGYNVVARTSSTEALELFQEGPDKFDLVITDITMPVMAGDRLARKIMELRRDIPIIMCTGYSKSFTEEDAKSIGIQEYLLKPLGMSALAETVRKVLDRL